jgi:hypothetical protein
MAKESHVSSELVQSEREISPSLHEAGGATVDVQVSTARRYPRSVTQFVQSATEMATLTPEIAASCVYAIPRDGKTIEGPSARLAEIVASAWGNLRIQAGATSDDGRFITARGEAWDVQNNVAVGFEVKRRVTNRKGETFGDDMIVVTGNAAASIALRNAVFKCVPSPFWRPIYLRCRQVIAGDARTFSSRRDDMLKAFAVVGVTELRLCAAIGLKGKADITLEHMATLAGILNALKEGETSVEEAFPETGPAVQAAPRKSQQAGFTPASTLASDVAAAILNTPIPGPKLEDVIRERAAGVVSAIIEKTDAAMTGTVGTIVSVNKRENGTALVMLSTGFRCGTADAALILTAEGYASTETIVQLVTEAPKTPAHAAKLVEIIGVDDREPGQEG